MTATHPAGRHRLRRSPYAGPRVGMVSVTAAAAIAGWLLALNNEGPQTMSLQAPQPAKAAPAQQIQRAGTVTAVSHDSLTTTAADGQVTTFRITPETTWIAAPFAPEQHVVVVGVVNDGVPVATAIADQSAVGANGRPMDYGLPT